LSDEQSEDIFGADPWPYGTDENWPSISVFLGYTRAQGLLDRVLGPEDLFVGLDQPA
jgi:4,5-dihydroxyphthalate decarboxylase